MGDHLAIRMPAELRYRDAVGALIQTICLRLEREGEESGLGHQVVSAFNEAFNNVALHAYQEEGQVDVLLEITPAEITIELHDEGRPYDYESVKEPELDELPESGLGLFIMRSFMSEVQYRPGSGGAKNVLQMRRALRGAVP